MALIPLALVYSLARERRLGAWAWSFLIPIAVLAGFQWWTLSQYGHGMLLDAAAYARAARISAHAAPATNALVAISFLGGCMLPALTFAPLLWPRRALLLGAGLAGLAAMAIATGWLDPKIRAPLQHPGVVGVELALCIAGGASALALAITDLWKHRNAESLLLALWVLGTVSFAGVFNWTVNARSILPAIPAVAILLARRLAARPGGAPPVRAERLAVPLTVAGAVALCVAWADYRLANDARREAWLVHERTSSFSSPVCFQGHWGFQYYLQPLGARPADADKSELGPGDIVAVPQNNTNALGVRPEYIAAQESVEVPTRAFGPVPPERCFLVRLGIPEPPRSDSRVRDAPR
jgi:hypothetical protein